MGLFNYVDYECDCPRCGQKIEGFQTKDGDPYLVTVNPWEVNNFYSGCKGCGVWIEYVRKTPLEQGEELKEAAGLLNEWLCSPTILTSSKTLAFLDKINPAKFIDAYNLEVRDPLPPWVGDPVPTDEEDDEDE